MTKKQKVLKAQKPVFADPLIAIKARFQRLHALRAEIARLKGLYKEHDTVMQELMPMFIQVQADKFIIAREITLGTEKYRFTPYFYDAKDGLKAKVWKSSAFEVGTIE